MNQLDYILFLVAAVVGVYGSSSRGGQPESRGQLVAWSILLVWSLLRLLGISPL